MLILFSNAAVYLLMLQVLDIFHVISPCLDVMKISLNNCTCQGQLLGRASTPLTTLDTSGWMDGVPHPAAVGEI